MQDTLRARAPLRLGLAGGGTDVSPFSDEHGGFVLNATIDLYAQAILEPLQGDEVHFVAEDRQESVVLPAAACLPDEEPLRLHRGIYNRMVRQFNGGRPLPCKLTTWADAPAGSGLGTSSTMMVCMVKAFAEWLRLGLGEYEVARIAFEVERQELGLAGGKQDQYAAAFGGFNFIEFGSGERVLVNPLRVKDWVLHELEASTVLYYTGQSRESARIIEQQVKASQEKASPSLGAMFELKQDALAMKEAILTGDLPAYAKVLERGWQAKKKLASGVSNRALDAIHDDVMDAGALAGKISGAGGGGFFMFYVPAARRMNVLRRLELYKGEVINFHFNPAGAQSWVLRPPPPSR